MPTSNQSSKRTKSSKTTSSGNRSSRKPVSSEAPRSSKAAAVSRSAAGRKPASRDRSGAVKTASRSGAGASRSKTGARARRKQPARRSASNLTQQVVIIAVFAVCLFLLIGNIGNGGIFGKAVSRFQFGLFGRLSYIAPFALFFSVVFLCSNQRNPAAYKKVIAAWVLYFCLCGFFHLATEGFDESSLLVDYYALSADYHTGGGIAAGLVLMATTLAFGWIGGMIVLGAISLICLIELTQKSFVDFVLSVSDLIHREEPLTEGDDSVRELKRELRTRKKRNATKERQLRQIEKLEQALEEEEEKERSLDRDEDLEEEDDLRYRDLIDEESESGNASAAEDQERQTRRKKAEPEEPVEYVVNEHGIRRKTDLDAEEEDPGPEQMEEDGSGRERKKRKKARASTAAAGRNRRGGSERAGIIASAAQALRHALSIELEEEDEGLDLMYSDAEKDPAGEEASFEEMEGTRLAIHRMYTEMMEEDPEDSPGFVVQKVPESSSGEKDRQPAFDGKRSPESLTEEPDTASYEDDGPEPDLAGEKKIPPAQTVSQVRLVSMPDFGSSDFGKYLSGRRQSGESRKPAFKDPSGDEDFGFFDHRDTEPEEENPDTGKEENSPADRTVSPEESLTDGMPDDELAWNGGTDPGEDPAIMGEQDISPLDDGPSASDGEGTAEKPAAGGAPAAGERSIESYMEGKVPKPPRPYVFPTVDLLAKPNKKHKELSDEVLKETADKLQNILYNFGVNVTVTDVSCGPTVTRYELQPELGVKVSRIVSLADDIKLNLAAEDIRIEAPIPGKAAVGIEVPNKERIPVSLRELIASREFRESPSKLSFAVGKDIAGSPVVTDIAQMPHLLIAGATGAGKSVCINTLIISILYKAKPTEVQMIMIDPKVVELSIYNGIPHLLIPVVTDPKKASGALNWAVDEMGRRYKKFSEFNVRNIGEFNHKLEKMEYDSDMPEKMTQIVIIVDELADLMMAAPGEVEDAICRLAQLARAAGIHLVIATQRPSVNVITGLIKANMPSRIAFGVSSGIDSRTILDSYGAEKLLGKGDMLFAPAGSPKPSRLQGAFVSDDEISSVVQFLKESNQSFISSNPQVEKQVSDSITVKTLSGKDDKDALFNSAGKFIIEKDRASIGQLQRVFKIGFNRAARIMDQLCAEGVVGPEEGTKPRKILMTMEEFEKKYES